MTHRHWLTVVFLCSSVAVAAQDVGMGRREGGGRRFEAPYTMEIRTPSVPWGAELPGPPLRVLAVPSVQEGRTLVELAQRLPMELTTVSIDPAWDVNKWTMAFGDDYGARAEQGDLALIYSYLEEELAGDKTFDVILLPLHHGRNALSEAGWQALRRRVEAGCGLVLIRPFDPGLSPLILAEPPRPSGEDDSDRPLEPQVESSPWRVQADHWLVRGIPVESFPFDLLEHYRYSAAPGAQVLVAAESGTPVLAVGEVGRGRVVAFGYRNIGISWRMPMLRAMVRDVDVYWEYFYSWLCRALIYAGRREPASAPDFSAATARWSLRAERGALLREGTGAPPSFPGLAPGRYFLEQRVPADWRIPVVDVPQPDRIEAVSVRPEVLEEGQTAQVSFSSTGPADVSVEDGFGRRLGSAVSPGSGRRSVNVRLGRPLTHGGVVRIRVGTAELRTAVRFAASSREWEDYEVILPWYGPNSYQPWIPALDEQFRRIGITTLEDPERNFRIIASVHDPVFGIYWYRRGNYEERKAEYLRTRDKQYLTRDVSLHAPDLEERMRERFRSSVGDVIPLKPFAYYLADESSVTCYADAFDVDWSPADLEAFRRWLRGRYSSLDELNLAWGTAFGDWNAVAPMTTEEAQQHGNYAPWAEHRIFMEEAFIRTIARGGEIAREFDPGARPSFSGTQIPTPHNGCNWYEIDQVADYLQPYSGGSQDAMHHLFRPGLKLTGFTGYGLVGDQVQHEVWERLFYGHSGASIFWHYTLLNPDLTFSEQGSALGQVIGRLQSGIGRIFMNAPVQEDGVAIHFSMASIRGAWITDGRIVEGVQSAERTSKNFAELMRRREAWVKQLESQGLQFRFLATPQIEAGELSRYRVLILPYSISLSDREAAAIEAFAAHGGRVFVDEHVGKMDEKNRWRRQQLWQTLPPGFVRLGAPGPIPVVSAFPVQAQGLTTVRRFGSATVYGFLPEKAVEVGLPASNRIRYDLLRSRLAAPVVAAGPAEPVLIVERDSRIAELRIGPELVLSLRDEQGRPVDRSVVVIRVFDPAGKLVRYYSGNADIRDGAGRFTIPFAENDARGAWRVEARDVVSGLTAVAIVELGVTG